ncbi:hypothetical protein GCM10018952_57080 [Streptosporangium vulgare]
MTHVIVVGTDGSAAGTAAVEWAADDAARADRPLRIVYAVDRWPYQISRFPNPAWATCWSVAPGACWPRRRRSRASGSPTSR